MLPKIISFSGKKHSGKTELTLVCKKYGYVCLNFADGLKSLVCHCLSITKDDLDLNKDKKVIYTLSSDNVVEYIASQTDIDINIINDLLKNKTFLSIREILQFVGTDIIRQYNPSWHIKQVRHKLLNSEATTTLFCIGDTRFPDEKALIESLNGETWYITRENYKDVNFIDHTSENSLHSTQFDNIINNNGSKEDFVDRWENYLKQKYK
jgi:hypothetical protein